MTERATPTPRAALDRAVRDHRGRLVASLASRSGDIAAAEDALSEACLRALPAWEARGVPDAPEAWLLTAARNVLRDRWKSAAHRTETAQDDAPERGEEPMDPETLPDERLALMFVCAHPAIATEVRTPLMLQTVLGLDPARMAPTFAMAAPALAQRLVRAKRKIRDARIAFAVPGAEDLAPRLGAVLEAIYGAYAITFQERAADPVEDTGTEALYLADLVVETLPHEPEALGLAALLNFSHARRDGADPARFVPLAEQDPATWNARRTARAVNLLRRAGGLGRIGPFQLEAAIQAVHADRARTGTTDWAAIAQLYAGLVRMAPTLGARVAQAAAIGAWKGAEAGLAALDRIQAPDTFQPYHAARAHLLAQAGRADAARDAYDRAIALSRDGAIRDWLRARR
ncbi:MAG: RNA polymerase sigma factor [Shimia sp.]